MENDDKNINENNEILDDEEEEKLQVGEISSSQEYNHGKIDSVMLSGKLKRSFLNYAMSVIVDRALPDARDGLKPVQRRILYGMDELKVYYNVAHKKSARIVGDVMGKYHPHGDSSIYEALVRMAQDFSYRYPLVDGHGNFGSIDGDGAAAMRYTEARMSKISAEMLRDLRKNTVDFVPNYDATELEPAVLPARIPNLLVNGATGIAVGMATNIPPHNLGEVIDGTIALMENPELSSEDLMHFIPGPDFPTGGIIMGADGLRQAYNTGTGTIVVRSKCEIIEPKNRKSHAEIIVTEIPYGIRKSTILERIGEVAKEHIVDGIVDLRDESSMRGMRIVIEVRNDVNPHVLLNNLYKYTQLQSSFGINNIALVDGRPEALSLKRALEVYINHQIDVITRRTNFELDEDLKRMHILEGFIIATDHIDEIIKIIRGSMNGEEKDLLMQRFNLSERQAQAILDMQLRRLSGLSRQKTEEEYKFLASEVERLRHILESKENKEEIIKNELLEIKAKYNDKRKSEMALHLDLNIENEDLIPRDDVLITITRGGYAKRMKTSEYRSQSRGGVGITGIKTKENDIVEHVISTSTHDFLLFFTNLGRVYKLKGYQIPEGNRTSKGIPLVNMINFQDGEHLAAVTNISDIANQEQCIFFATKKGIIKRTSVSQFQNIRTNGINAINLTEGDELLQVEVTDGHREIILGASNGKAIRFNEETVREIGRSATGVRGMKLNEGDELVGMAVVRDDVKDILVVTEKGYGKRTDADEYRLQTRGGMGVKTLNITDKNGRLASLRAVNDDLDLIATTNKGVTIRMHCADISQTGRAAQGVKLIRLRDDQHVSSIAIVEREDDEVVQVESPVASQEVSVDSPQENIQAE
ncbi:MAG TPA: DNA gyrase subunit A [Acholeplasmatales bacterium]|nr:DNA gyrase subunit A [Acholeplasmatales bacterium]